MFILNIVRVKHCIITSARLQLQCFHTSNSSNKILQYLFGSKTRNGKELMAVSNIFDGSIDEHKGITIESRSNICNDITVFTSKLEASLEKWNEDKLRGVWFNIDISHIAWIPVLAQKGFKIHHARDDTILLYLWLPKNESCKIPHYAHNMVGAGALVINEKNQVLVVRERYRTVSFWKLPGGYVEPGEEIAEAAQREVLEETGVKTEFVSLLSLRHLPKSHFGCSDIYIVVRLKPLTSEINKQDDEIVDCQWMDVDKFLAHPEVHDVVRNYVIKAMNYEKEGIMMVREEAKHPFTKKPQFTYTLKTNKAVT